MPLRRSSRSEPAAHRAPQSEEPDAAARPGSKGRPTRTRREAEAARRRPLVPEDRKEARRRSRTAQNAERSRQQQAMMTGDEAHMPLQHRGPERRFVRDVVDSRHNLAEYFFPAAIVLMVIFFVLPFLLPDLTQLTTLMMLVVLWGGIALCVLDAFLLRRRLRRDLTSRFGGVGAGLVGYGISRAVSLRRLRLPKPKVRHGERPL